MTLHFLIASLMTLNTKIENNTIIASLKRKTIGKLINRIPGLHLLISSVPGSNFRTPVESLSKPGHFQQAFSKPCLVNLISKDPRLVFSIYMMSTVTCLYPTTRCLILLRGDKCPIKWIIPYLYILIHHVWNGPFCTLWVISQNFY